MSLFSFWKVGKFQWIAVGGFLLILLIAITALMNKSGSLGSDLEKLLAFNVTGVRDNAFGELKSGQTRSSEADSAEPDRAISSPGFGGDGGVAPDYYDPVRYEFEYQGEDFELTGSHVSVLRRLKNQFSQTEFARNLATANLGLLNLGALRGPQLQNIQIAESGNDGFRVFVDLLEGQISMDKNTYFADERVFRSPGELPSDDRVIAAANQFLGRHGISRENYGDPVVVNDWLIAYEQTADKSGFYIPQALRVVYPLKLENQTVYEQSGEIAGLSVNVSAVDLSVYGLWNLTTQNYESSRYEAVSDREEIFELVRQGGIARPYFGEEGRVVKIGAGTPERGHVKIFNFHENTHDELYVPALIFPVISVPEGEFYWQQNIIIPLAIDLIVNIDGPVYPLPVPVPLDERPLSVPSAPPGGQ